MQNKQPVDHGPSNCSVRTSAGSSMERLWTVPGLSGPDKRALRPYHAGERPRRARRSPHGRTRRDRDPPPEGRTLDRRRPRRDPDRGPRGRLAAEDVTGDPPRRCPTQSDGAGALRLSEGTLQARPPPGRPGQRPPAEARRKHFADLGATVREQPLTGVHLNRSTGPSAIGAVVPRADAFASSSAPTTVPPLPARAVAGGGSASSACLPRRRAAGDRPHLKISSGDSASSSSTAGRSSQAPARPSAKFFLNRGLRPRYARCRRPASPADCVRHRARHDRRRG